MIYRALKSFSGVISMHAGEKRGILDESLIEDLMRAGYIEEFTINENQTAKKETKKK